MQPRKLIEFMGIMENLKNNTRHSWTSSGRHESVAEHSWRTAMLAFFMKDEFPNIDIEKVIRMCLMHDIGEAVTGDIPSFTKTQRDENTEQLALTKLFASLPQPWPQELGELFEEMEALQTPEAKLYKALDKLEVILQHNEADLSTWIDLEYDLNLVHGTRECEFSEYLQRLRQELRNDTMAKIQKGRTPE